MSKQPETLFKERVQKALKKLSDTWSVKVQQVAIRGTPDILVCLRGQFVALELKRNGLERPDPLQEVTMDRIVAAGGWAFVAYPENWKVVYTVLQLLAQGRAQEAAAVANGIAADVKLKDDRKHH